MTHKEQFEELITIISKSCKRHNIALSECEINLIAVDILGDRTKEFKKADSVTVKYKESENR